MKVRTIMTRDVATCAPETPLRDAALMMREADAGVLPVLVSGRACGVVTDRDICLGLAERDCRPSEVPVREVMSRSVCSCSEDDSVETALSTMRSRRVRRLPVLAADGTLRGILSMNDVLLHSREGSNREAIAYDDAIQTLQTICEHRNRGKARELVDATSLEWSV